MENKMILEKSADNFLSNMIFEGASSGAIMIYKSNKLILHKSTSYKWQDFYSNSKEVKNCHITKMGIELAKKYKSFSLIWDNMIPNNDDSFYLNEKRKEYEHCHGISICQSISKDLVFATILTGKRCHINFAQSVINNKRKIINEILKLRNINNF